MQNATKTVRPYFLILFFIVISNSYAELVAYWDFNAGSGDTLHDVSGHNNHGVINGPVWSPGVQGNALVFDGLNDNVTIADNDTFTTGEITITLWFSASKLDSTARLISKDDGAGTGRRDFLVQTGPSFTFSLFNSDASQLAIASYADSSILPNSWHFIGCTFTADSLRLYVDGKLRDVEYLPNGMYNSTAPLLFGTFNKDKEWYNGKLDDVAIYNHALSAGEIDSIWQTYLDDISLLAYWDFNDSTGNKITDKAGKGNSGTIVEAVWVEGVGGTALHFDGTNDYVRIDSSLTTGLNFTGNELAISAWIKPTGAGSTVQDIVDCSHTMTGYRFGYHIGNNGVKFSLNEATNYNSGGGVIPNQWNHVVGVYTNDSLCLWINSAYYGSKFTNFGVRHSPVVMTVGAYRSATAEQFNGAIDETRIYRRALTYNEILALYLEFAQLPTLLSAVASDGNVLQTGIDDDDYVLFTFEKAINTNQFQVTEHNIDSLLPLSSSHTWKSAFGTIGSADWNPDSTMLMVTLSTTVGPPTVAPGDTVSLTRFGNKIIITGSFGPTSIKEGVTAKSLQFKMTKHPDNTKVHLSFNNTPQKAHIQIFNLNGRQVASFRNIQDSRIVWDARHIPSGVYIVKLLIDNAVVKKNLFLMK